MTGIPKETVRRKIKNLMNSGFLLKDKKNNGYSWNLPLKEKVAKNKENAREVWSASSI